MIASKIKKGYTEVSTDAANAPASSELPLPATSLEKIGGATSQSGSWERVFVRDIKAESPDCIGQAMNYSRCPFESDSGGSGGGPPHLLPENTQKWFIQLWDKNHGWASLFCNCASGKAMFDASSRSSRLEVVHLGRDDQKHGWFFRYKRAGKRHVDFELPTRVMADLSQAKFKAAELEREFLDGCQTGHDVIKKLCREFAIITVSVCLDCSGSRPEIVDTNGEPAKSRIGAYSNRTAPGLEWGDDPAADLLQDGVDALDAHVIRQAIQQGADANRLPERNVTPLKVLLHECPDPRAQECIEVLLESGVSLDGESGTPAVFEHTAHYESEERVIGKLSVLVALGADVNAVDQRDGETVLFDNVRRRRTDVVRCLVELGADATISNQSGLSVIDIINKEIAKAPSSPGISIGSLPRHRKDSADEWQTMLNIVLRRTEDTANTDDDNDQWRASTDQVAPEVSLCVRQNIADQTNTAIEKLSPQTNLAGELNLDDDSLTSILVQVCLQFEVVIAPLLKQITSSCRLDEHGYLTEESKSRLKDTLPSFPVDAWEDWTETGVFMSIAFIEAMVTAGIDLRNAKQVDIEDLPIGGLNERQQRLLLTGTFRFLWHSASNNRMRLEMSDALEAIEVFADTGKTKTALNRARSSFRGMYINSRKPWRNAPESVAIDTALANEDPKAALGDMVYAVKQILELSTQQALSRLADFATELVAPAAARKAFLAKWRSPRVVELAKEMYNSRDFSRMPKLADVLQDAGCDNDLILNHCRDSNRWHMRGCWVVDVILDGSWARPVKKPRGKKKKSVIGRLPKSAQLCVRQEEEHCFADIEFEAFIARMWDWESYASVVRSNATQFVEKQRSNAIQEFPCLSAEQIDAYLSFQQLSRWLPDKCMARRVLREDPSEVGRGLSVLYRIRYAMLGAHQGFDVVGALCSTHHWDIAGNISVEFLSQMVGRGFKNFDYIDLRQLAFASIIADDSHLLPQLWAEMTKGKKPPWLTAWYVVLKAIADRDPSAIAEGLQAFLARF